MLEALAAKVGGSLLFGKLKSIHIPLWVWLVAAGVILTLGAVWFHSHEVDAFERNIRDDQSIKDHSKFTAELDAAHADAEKWKKNFTDSSTKITTQESSDHEKAVSNSATLASRLHENAATGSYRGQVNSPATEPSTSGHAQGSGTAVNATVGPVSNDQRTNLISVPLDDLITFAQHYDDNADEVKTWRKDKTQQENLYKTLLNDQVSGK